MASRQFDFATMSPRDQAQQSQWAQSIIHEQAACPEENDWVRRDGGYQCTGGGHGLSDSLIAEGKNGVLSLPTHTWCDSDGIFYPMSNGSGKYKRPDGPRDADKDIIPLHAPGARWIPTPPKEPEQ